MKNTTLLVKILACSDYFLNKLIYQIIQLQLKKAKLIQIKNLGILVKPSQKYFLTGDK